MLLQLVKDLLGYIEIEHGTQIKNLSALRENIKSIAPRLTQLDEPVPCYLLLFKEDERKFLESVSDAITKNIMPAKVISFANENEILQNRFVKYLLYPKSQLPHFQKLKDMTIHVPYEIDGVTHLLLADVARYTEDINLKRSLWNILKNTLPSSQTLPSIKL